MRKRKLYLKSKLSSLHAKQESRLCSLLKSNLHIWTAPDLLGLELDILMTDQKREPILDHLVTTQLLGEISHISDSEIGLEAEEEDEEEAEDDHLTEVISHPFDLHKEDDENPFSVFAREIVNALRTTPQDSTKPDYRGIEKPKLDTFSGDASVYAHWKRRFHTLYSPERNLSDSYLANTLYALLKGEARAQVEAHFTTDWNGDSYHRMWEQLDLDYGSEHIQDRCIQDRAARIPPLDQESLKTVGKFYLELTVQINYYQLSQPEVLTRSNNHLYQLMRHKINDDLLIKFIEWCRLHASDDLPPRSLIALQAWLLERLEVLREAETFSNSARQRSSKSPSRSSYTGTIEPEVEDESDSDTDPTHSVLLTHSDGKKVMFNKQKNKHFRYKPAFGEKRTPGTFIKSGNQAAYRQSFETTDTLCPVCRDVSHELSTCPKFKKLITYKRYAIVRQCRGLLSLP
jgi:hypothetical protein